MEEHRPSIYTLKPARIKSEDVLICVDIDAESMIEMKSKGTNGRPLLRMDCIKQSIILFIHNKLSINPDHRFSFATLTKSAVWLRKDFTSNAETAIASLRVLSATKSSSEVDLTLLFRAAGQEAIKSRAQNRILRVILVYCRSSVRPTYDWPIDQKLFTLDVMYLHDKPGPDNCPRDVYDSLVEAVERVSEYEGYTFESGQGLTRSVFKPMSVLLSHPQQRCALDDLDIPKSLVKKVDVVEAVNVEDYHDGKNVQNMSQ